MALGSKLNMRASIIPTLIRWFSDIGFEFVGPTLFHSFFFFSYNNLYNIILTLILIPNYKQISFLKTLIILFLIFFQPNTKS